MWIKIDNFMLDSSLVSIDIDNSLDELLAKFLQVKKIVQYKINSKSIDARRGIPQIVFSIFVEISKKIDVLPKGCSEVTDEIIEKKYNPKIEIPVANFATQPIVVGTGPAGIFAGLILAKAGAKPIILDAGFQVDKRQEKIEEFLETRELDEKANYLIGEGGAGAFSDGKLYTRVKDPYCNFILKTLVELGAPEEIIYLKRPHIGSDNLVNVAINLREKIEELGGEFHFESEVVNIIEDGNKIKAVELSNGEKIYSDNVILACGLGGRKVTSMLVKKGVKHKLKGFQIGCRIEHPQMMINSRQYRMREKFDSLPVAEYNFVSSPPKGTAKVSTFCMCPGGEVVMASAWKEQVSSNGMSYYNRAGEFGNSCLIMTLSESKFGTASAAYKYLEKLERAAFDAGGSDYTLVAQSASAFIAGKEGLIREDSSCKVNITPARIDAIFSPEHRQGIIYALEEFDRKCPGFISEGQIIGIETCISSPVMFVRDENLESSINGLYVAGEGAGCAGGIMSASIDGLNIALKMLEKKNH